MSLTNHFSDIDENGEESNVINNDSIPDNTQKHNVPNPRTPNQITWRVPDNNYIPRKALPPSNNSPATVLAAVNRSFSELEVFLKLFPRSLFKFISQSTNERLNILNKTKHTKIDHTDPSEMMIVIGSLLVMSYNRVPNMQLYWSTNKSMGNEALKSAISRDRFLVLLSKLYFNNPSKPPDANKTYYTDEVVSCLKKTFIASRSDSSYQSIDESMAKFKGRSALKQYMPLKPIKRGIKIWQSCDALTGYVYDLNIYAGKETEQVKGTLGERVVAKLCDTIQNANVALCFDRFFTSVNLMTNIQFPAFGTCNRNRKSLPDFGKKLKERGAMEVDCSDTGLLATKWKDTKEVILLSNCHTSKVSQVDRKNKDGSKTGIPCPDVVLFYNKHMGGVDLADQLASLYDIDRKSNKWWKKVFYKLLLTSVVNAWVLYQDVHHKKLPLLQFIVPLAKQLISFGRQNASIKRRRCYGRPSQTSMSLQNVGEHLPVEGTTRRRYHNCHKKKKEKRTKIMCSQCNVALCMNCFSSFHR